MRVVGVFKAFNADYYDMEEY